MNVRVKKIILSVLCCVAMIGCSAKKEEPKETVTIKLAAAASLKNAYDNELIPLFESKYPNVKIEATYASSGDLQTQIENGFDADVFMSAATKQMKALKEENYIKEDKDLLVNKVVLIAPVDATDTIASYEELKNLEENQVLAIGNPESVPAGQYAKEILDHLSLWDALQPKLSMATDVTSVLNQVAQKSADYGIVYATDAASIKDVQVICEADDSLLETPVIYPLGTLTDKEETKVFYEFLQSEEALDIFKSYGFSIY